MVLPLDLPCLPLNLLLYMLLLLQLLLPKFSLSRLVQGQQQQQQSHD